MACQEHLSVQRSNTFGLEKGLTWTRAKEASYHLPHNTASTQSIVLEQRRQEREGGTETRPFQSGIAMDGCALPAIGGAPHRGPESFL